MNNISFPTLILGRHRPKYPLVQGGMGVCISGPRLAGHTAAAGAVGTLASVGLFATDPGVTGTPQERNEQAVERALTLMRAQAPHGVLAVNCMVALKDYDRHVAAACRGGADVIISGAGLPLNLPRLTAAYPDVALVPIVSTLRAAEIIIKRWTRDFNRLPDGFVLETPHGAGGHLGAKDQTQVYAPSLSLDVQLPLLVQWLKEKELNIPVIAAGGLWSRDDVNHCFALGASGVQLGSRFVATFECDADDRFKQAYIDAAEGDAVLIDSPAGLPGRALKTPLVNNNFAAPYGSKTCIADCLHQCRCRDQNETFCIANALINAWRGNWEKGLFFCGSLMHQARQLVSVQSIIDDLFPSIA